MGKRVGGFLYPRKEMLSVVLKAHKHFLLSPEGHVSDEQQGKVLSKAETLGLTPCLAHSTQHTLTIMNVEVHHFMVGDLSCNVFW